MISHSKNMLRTVLGLVVGILLMQLGCAHRRAEKAYTLYSLGTEAFNGGDVVRAHTYLLQAYELYPRDPDVEQMLGLVIFARGDFDGSNEYLKRAEQHFESSIKHYEKFEPLPNQEANRLSVAEARVNLSAVYIGLGRYDEAIELAELARQDPMYRTPDRANYNIGWAYVQKKQPLTAIKYLRLSVEQNRRFAGGYKTLGEVYLGLNKYPEAISNLNRAIEIYPKYAEAMYWMGVVYQKQKNRTLAQRMFKKCYDTEPQGPFGERCQEFIR